ncbi:MAG: hypothetical protein EOM80_08205 [Erysipelotrichia bacterium]|nr:hypothetical protein [Erysipelotrichia bacterium]
MKNKIISSLIIISLGFIGAASAKPSGILINGLQYEVGLASAAVVHQDICAIAYGKDDSNVGGDQQSDKHRVGGAPTSYTPLADGSFWVMDSINQKAKHFAANGSLLASFVFPGSTPKRFVNMKDMAVIPTGGLYLYNSTQGIVFRVDDKGATQVQIEGLPDSREIGVDSKGNLLVANPVMKSLLRFNPAGELIERYDGQTSLSTVVDAADKPLGVKFNDLEAELFRADKASPTVTISLAKFPLQTPKERNAHYVSAKLIGSDAKKNLYLELIACDKEGVIHQYRVIRLNGEGKVLSQADLLAVAFLSPRNKEITPDGKVFGFRSDKKSWFPITYTLP